MYLDVVLLIFEAMSWIMYIFCITCCCCIGHCCCSCYKNFFANLRKQIDAFQERLNIHTTCHIALYGSTFKDAYSSSKIVTKNNTIKFLFLHGVGDRIVKIGYFYIAVVAAVISTAIYDSSVFGNHPTELAITLAANI